MSRIRRRRAERTAAAEPAPGPAEVALVVVAPDDAELRARVLGLFPRPDQEPWSGQALATLPWADSLPGLHPFAVLADGTAVGFGIIDRRPLDLVALSPRPDRAVLLRSFYLDAGAQGRGIGRRALRGVGPFVRALVPGAVEVVLTVNVANEPAVRAYLAAGFVDDGDVYRGGRLGPQHILRLPLPVLPR